MRYIELKESEKSILKEKMRSRISFREQQRIHCIILSSKKYKIEELSDIFEVDRDTIARWLDWWEEDGQAGLKDAVKRGRPCILTEEESKEVIKLVEENPRQLKKVIPEVKERFGKTVSSRTIKRTIKKKSLFGKDAESRLNTKEMKKSLI
jgi:transposase